MFRLHDNTRRRICIAGFFALCVVPTVAVACWCLARHAPGHVAAEARRLGRQLGVKVSLGGVEHIRPGAVLYRSVELSDPETGRSFLRCRVLEAGWKKAANRQAHRADVLVLIASQPEIETDALDDLGRVLRKILRRRTGGPEFDVRLSAGEVTLHRGENSQTLTELYGGIETMASGTDAQIAFRLPGVRMAEPVRIRITRNRQTVPPGSALELDTGGGAVPCGVLGLVLSELSTLGPGCRFRGYLWANQTPGSRAAEDWDGELTGQLLEVDLDRVLTDRFPHKLSGTADVMIRRARFRRGRLEEAAGVLTAGPGVISRSLIDAAAAQLALVCPTDTSTLDDLIPYEQLALECVLDAAGLSLQGRCDAGRRMVLVDRRRCLLGEPPAEPQPVVALLRTLVPQNELQVPATRQTDWLMRCLPVPEVVYPKGDAMSPPSARVRLGRTFED